MSETDSDTVLKSVFKKYDTDGNSTLGLPEFTRLLTDMGKHIPKLKGVSSETIPAIFALMDKNSNGHIEYDEFRKWWMNSESCNYATGEKSRNLRKAYGLYRQNSSEGKMSSEQFSELMRSLNLSYSEEDFYVLDQNSDGDLSFQEFCDWLRWF